MYWLASNMWKLRYGAKYLDLLLRCFVYVSVYSSQVEISLPLANAKGRQSMYIESVWIIGERLR